MRYPEIHANDHKYEDYCDLFICAWRGDRRIKMQIVVCARWSSCKGATRKTCSKEIEISARLGPLVHVWISNVAANDVHLSFVLSQSHTFVASSDSSS